MKTLPIIPEKETRVLSLNLALVPLPQEIAISEKLGFDPELVKFVYKEYTEYHLLLWQGAIDDTPSDLDDRIDAMADEIDPKAIRHAWQSDAQTRARIDNILDNLRDAVEKFGTDYKQ